MLVTEQLICPGQGVRALPAVRLPLTELPNIIFCSSAIYFAAQPSAFDRSANRRAEGVCPRHVALASRAALIVDFIMVSVLTRVAKRSVWCAKQHE